jgi:uncharacterized protein (DUF58 family)
MFGFLFKRASLREEPVPTKGKRLLEEAAPTEGWSFSGLRLQFSPRLSVVLSRRFFTLVVLFLAFYAFAGETGSEWIYLLVAAILAVLALSAILPFFQVLDTSVAVAIPPEAMAGERIIFEVEISHAILPGFLAKLFPLRALRVKMSFEDQDGQTASHLVRPVVVEYVGDRQSFYFASEPLRRGVYKFEALEVACCFPFTLVWWLSKMRPPFLPRNLAKREGELTVYPVLMPVRGRFLQALFATNEVSGRLIERHRSAQTSSSVRGLRDYREGDSPRWVHWHSYARTGKLVVKEFDSESSRRYFVAFDPDSDWRTREQFELAVALVHSIINCGAEQVNFELMIPPAKYTKSLINMASGPKLSREILARVQPGPGAETTDTKEGAAKDYFQKIEKTFHETLKRHPSGVLFNIVPGGSSKSVNLLEATIDKNGYAVTGGPKIFHARTKVVDLLDFDEKANLEGQGRGRVIARVSHLEQISMV